MPDEPVRALAIMSTLMPHLAAGRQNVYRNVIVLALLASLLAAAFGSLSISLVLAAVALPAAVLVYVHDHGLWRAEPVTVIGVSFGLSLALGVGVGVLQHFLVRGARPAGRHLPSPSTILELGVVVPVVAFVALLIAPLLVTQRQAFRHPVDEMVTCALSGAALSLGMSVVVQSGAFTHIQATSGAPARVAFIALTLGFLQPILFATAAAVAVIRVREAANAALGIVAGLLLVVVYGLATTFLAPYGERGIVLTALVALVLVGAGVVATRTSLHTTLLAEAQDALRGAKVLSRSPDADQVCAHCGAAIDAGAAFCQVCGTATAALARHAAPPSSAPAAEPSA